MSRQAVGRGEQWESEWPEEKTGTANLMSFSRGNTNYDIDVFHTMACCTILLEGRYSPDDQGYLFPCFVNMRKGGASAKVTNTMKNCVGKVKDVTDKMTASGLWLAQQMKWSSLLKSITLLL
eukprot:15334065-Ditylum_brightwellii.AAC.1